MGQSCSELKIAISALHLRHVFPVVRMYWESSKEVKALFIDPPVLTNWKWFVIMCLCATPLKHVLPAKVHGAVATVGDKVVGFVYITEKRGNKQIGIMVKEGCWGCGIGDRLMNAIMRGQSGVTLIVRADNERAKSLYKKYGFKPEYTLEYMSKL